MIQASFHPISQDDEGRSSNHPRLSSKYEMKERIVPAGWWCVLAIDVDVASNQILEGWIISASLSAKGGTFYSGYKTRKKERKTNGREVVIHI